MMCRVLTADYPNMPTLPKDINTLDDLQDYIEQLKSFASIFNRSRFGKRKDPFEIEPSFGEKDIDQIDGQFYDYEV